MKPRIAIPEPVSTNTAYNERSWPEYARAIEESGGIAVKIFLHLSPAEVARLVSSCVGVLLPGSPADINPQKYGGTTEPHTSPADPAREAVDELLLQDAFNLQKPLFGICYGLQSLNVWKGGTLIQDLQTGVNHKPGRDVQQAHLIQLEDSRLAGLLGTRTMVNSSHHQAVETAGDSLKIAALSPDGVIEALEGLGEQFLVGVQWHPERIFEQCGGSKALFSAFVRASATWRPRLIRESLAP